MQRGYLIASGSSHLLRQYERLALKARQLKVDFVLLCTFLTIVLKSSSIKPLGNCSGKKSLTITSEFAVPSEKPNAPMKSCYVVFEDISCHYDAEKPVWNTST